MSIPRLARPSRLWRSLEDCSSCRRTLPRDQRRSLHHMPILKKGEAFERNGVPGLLSAEGYFIAWTQYQELMIKRLNTITAGFPEENQTPKAILLQHARNPTTASLFNHASMAHNNHLFFDGLSGVSGASRPLTDYKALHTSLEKTFGSIETLRTTMVDTAGAMFGPGFVWLVWARGVKDKGTKDAWRILTTYLAGTPYPEAGYRQQGVDQNTVNNRPENNVGSFGRHSGAGKAEANKPPGSAYVEPVLCVNTWEHVYLRDYGVQGKREYLNKWWESIDWHEADSRMPQDAKEQRSFMRR